jgi:RNA polymerase sigma-70 factor (ECF subfamily)
LNNIQDPRNLFNAPLSINGNLNRTIIKTLFRKAGKGDQRAQYQIFKEYYSYVMAIALRYTHQSLDAEEVANDAFLRIFRHLDKYNESLSFKNWISKITVNASIDFLRKNKKNLYFLEINDRTPAPTNNEDFDINVNKDTPILPILQELSPQYRIVFNLYVFEDYKHKEIAEKLNISIGTSKSNYARAKKIITEKLKEKKYIDQLLTKTQ